MPDPATEAELGRLRNRIAALEANGAELLAKVNGSLYRSAEGDVSAVHALVARWQQGVANLYAANEEEAVAETAMIRAARAAQIECCIKELRDALSAPESNADAPSPVSTATEVSGGLNEPEETRE